MLHDYDHCTRHQKKEIGPFERAWVLHEIKESCWDCDFSVLILLELEDAPDELDQSDDASTKMNDRISCTTPGRILPLMNLWIPRLPRKKMITRYKILLIFSISSSPTVSDIDLLI